MASGSETSDMLMAMGKDELKRYMKKVDARQLELTSESHILKVDSFIPAAERFAKKNAKGDLALKSKLFLSEMNRLTSKAGLRCC